ncbi:hypothetical protein [Wenxinia saemankumensis]|uniref:Uncharacterized protein n=1 Tax=Wenxinia saemankumensis TaxID=1447782 RepID=A0A1M6F0Y6_9RHOB|nr:hypothetical protein [Wenxinia saemankumensis]SHI91343.1 hypothetical protein SAMN05444417_2291 [Wenxinia saemankumensis]
MPRHTTISLQGDETWTQLTAGDATAATFQVINDVYNSGCLIQCTATGTAPTSDDGAIRIFQRDRAINEDLADLFPGLTSPVRLWAKGGAHVRVAVSHA